MFNRDSFGVFEKANKPSEPFSTPSAEAHKQANYSAPKKKEGLPTPKMGNLPSPKVEFKPPVVKAEPYAGVSEWSKVKGPGIRNRLGVQDALDEGKVEHPESLSEKRSSSKIKVLSSDPHVKEFQSKKSPTQLKQHLEDKASEYKNIAASHPDLGVKNEAVTAKNAHEIAATKLGKDMGKEGGVQNLKDYWSEPLKATKLVEKELNRHRKEHPMGFHVETHHIKGKVAKSISNSTLGGFKMASKTIQGNEFFKSLGNLEALAKGDSEDLNKSQLFHTGSNSKVSKWGDGGTEEVGEEEVKIKADGTDYTGVRKSIAFKIKKGIPLTPNEIELIRYDLNKANESDDEDDKGEDEGSEADEDEDEGKKKEMSPFQFKGKDKEDEDEEEPPMPAKKSFNKSIQRNDTLSDALEMSGFLTEFAKSFGIGLDQVEKSTANMIENSTNAILKRIGSYLDSRFEEQSEFNKSLADAVVNIGHGLAGALGYQAELANQPAYAPKSQAALNKSYNGPQGDTITKSQKLDVMGDLATQGKLDPLEVIRYESSGEINPTLDAKISNIIRTGGLQ